MAVIPAKEVSMTTPAMKLTGSTSSQDIIDLLKAHEYFRSVSEAALGEIARFGTVTHYDAAAIVHELNDPLASICFILRGRLKSVRVDSRGVEHLFQMFERGEQYGMMLGGLGESVPVRMFALEPSIILSLDHEKAMELTLLYPDLRRQWLQSYARSLRRRFLEPAAGQAPRVLAMLHQSAATRNLAQKIIGRLQGLGEAVCVLSDADSWQSVSDLRFRSLLDGNRLMDVAEIRRQVGEWNQAQRIVVDTTAAQNLDWAVLLRAADCALVFIRPHEISSAIERLRALELASRGWVDKVAVVWVLEDSGVAPEIPEVHEFAKREFKICQSPLPHPWGKVHSASMERLVHYLRGVRIGVALGGGAARGMAHLGVLKTLEDSGIVPDVIVGTSVGAMTGVLYSAGLDCDYLIDHFTADLKLPWVFRHLPSGGYWYLLYKYRRGQFDPMLRKYLRDWKLEQLAVPCRTVTVDLVSGHAVVRDRGDAVQAILESINLPMLSTPICRNGQALIDGGVVDNIPADVLTSEDCNFLIAVSVTAKIKSEFGVNKPETPTLGMQTPSSVQTLLRTLEVQNFNLNRVGAQPAEVVIEPEVVDFDLSEFMRAKELARVGEQAALIQLPKIKQLLARLDAGLFRFAQ
jgi:predicted acylesterase/phospholipase RssA/CRP-like cAMP-binding protein